jgi:GNAT superfamily N-acetyltransferase
MPVRAATMEDEHAVTEVLAASYTELLAGHYRPDILAAALPLMTKANPKLLACGTYYVAEMDDGRVAAVGGWTRERPGAGGVTEGEAHLRHIGTHPDFIGRGIGRAIVRRCLDEAKGFGVVRMWCDSTLQAEGFYRALGFRTVEGIEIKFGGVMMPNVRMVVAF